jgi:hypothetical protein
VVGSCPIKFERQFKRRDERGVNAGKPRQRAKFKKAAMERGFVATSGPIPTFASLRGEYVANVGIKGPLAKY